MRLPVLFTTLAAFALCLAPPAAAERLTLSPSGHLMTPVMVNGAGPFEFAVDTAAGGSVVYPALRDRLGLTPLEGGRASVQGASGRASVSLFRLDQLIVAGRTRGPLTAVGLEAVGAAAPDLAGIVGVDVISAFVAEFDAPGGRFLLHEPAADLAGPGWTAVPFTLNRARFPVIEGMLDERPIVMLLDTGARRTVINWAAAGALGIAPGDAAMSEAEPIRGATDHQTPAVKRDFRSVVVGGVTLSAAEITIADLPVFNQLGWADRPAMILGMDRLRSRRFAVDYPRTRLLVAAQAPPAR